MDDHRGEEGRLAIMAVYQSDVGFCCQCHHEGILFEEHGGKCVVCATRSREEIVRHHRISSSRMNKEGGKLGMTPVEDGETCPYCP